MSACVEVRGQCWNQELDTGQQTGMTSALSHLVVSPDLNQYAFCVLMICETAPGLDHGVRWLVRAGSLPHVYSPGCQLA